MLDPHIDLATSALLLRLSDLPKIAPQLITGFRQQTKGLIARKATLGCVDGIQPDCWLTNRRHRAPE